MGSVDQIFQRAQEAGVKLVRLHYCDYGGIVRAKGVALNGLSERIAAGVALPVSVMALNALDQPQPIAAMGLVGAVRLLPDPESFVLLPYVAQSAALACDLLTSEREPWAACPRGFLKRMRAQLGSRGWSLHAAFESTFYLARRDEGGEFVPADDALTLSTIGMNHSAGFATTLISGLESQGITPELLSPAAGHGQHTLAVRHTEALRAADHHVRVRETIRGVAAQQSLIAALAPRPFHNQPGSGVSIHLSLLDDAGRNLFFDGSAPDRLSLLARGFLAGLLNHLPALAAITCPSVNSYRRLRAEPHSGGYTTWGHDNFQAAVRVTQPHWQSGPGAAHLELRVADHTCNPYLALGALIAAGLDGIEQRTPLTPPIAADPSGLSEDERHEGGARRLPLTPERTLDQLEADRVLERALGPLLLHSFLAVRHSESRAFASQGDAFELAQHFARY